MLIPSAILANEVPTDGRRILLIDDEASIAEMYASVLRLYGHSVRVAVNGVSGLNAAREADYDLVVVDITMPGMDGMQVLGELVKDSRSAEWPIVLLTGLDDPSLRTKARGLGARDYLLKSKFLPIQLAELVPGWTKKPVDSVH